jgi:hypothetical protein
VTTPKPTRTVFVVQRIGWTFNDQWFYRDGREDDQPVVAYASRAQAEAELLYFDREAWPGVNPFLYGERFSDLTHLSEDELVRHIEQLGLSPPPEPENRDWSDWWEGIEGSLTLEQCEGIWRVMTKIQLHEIVPVEIEPESGT